LEKDANNLVEGRIKLKAQPEEYKWRGMSIFMEKGLKVVETAVLWVVSCINCLILMYS